MSKKIDVLLQEKLFKRLDKLRRKIDWIADKSVRQQLDELATQMYNIITENSEESKK